MTSQSHILVVDDEHGILASLKKIYERENFRVSTTDSGEEALEIVRSEHVDLVLSDIMMPKMSGIELLRAVKAISPSIEVVMMTAFGTVENAVECMREGAYDFVSKPLKRAIVVRCVQRALEHRSLVHENQILRETIENVTQGDVVGQSASIRLTLETLAQAAPSQATVLLYGESGTGKELLAQKVHSLSDRKGGPFVAVNCAALPDNLLESELFGHEKGAFTGASARREGRFERASGGTLFLDEIGETSSAVQVRLLRVLQEGEIERLGGNEIIPVDVRVVAATNRSLEQAVEKGEFREDLYYRLNVIQIEVPPLRNRHGDIILLAQHFLARFAEKNNKTMRGFSEAALRVLESHRWAGNVRELENTIERCVVLCRGDIVGVDDLPKHINKDAPASQQVHQEDGIFVPYGVPLEEVEKKIIRHTLERTGGDKNTAARLLGIASRTIYRKLDES